jgi:hypothetical protein
MKLTISLGADEKHPAPVLDMELNHSRRFTQTSQYVVDRMQVTEVRVGKRAGKGKQEDLLITLNMKTEWFRQKVDVSVALMGVAGQAWNWKDRVVLGMTAGDAMNGGLGIANASKSKTVEVKVPLTDELRQALGADPRLEIVATIVD